MFVLLHKTNICANLLSPSFTFSPLTKYLSDLPLCIELFSRESIRKDGDQHFLLFPKVFEEASLLGFYKRLIVIATGLIPLSPLSIVSTMVMWESSQWLGKNIVQSTG